MKHVFHLAQKGKEIVCYSEDRTWCQVILPIPTEA